MDSSKYHTVPTPQRHEQSRRMCDSCGRHDKSHGNQHRSCQRCLKHISPCSCFTSKSPEPKDPAASAEGAQNFTTSLDYLNQDHLQSLRQSRDLSSWFETGLDANNFGNEKMVNSRQCFPADIDHGRHDESGGKLAKGRGGNDEFNLDLDLDMLCSSTMPSNLLGELPDQLPERSSRLESRIGVQVNNNFPTRVEDHNVGTFSSIVSAHREHGPTSPQHFTQCSNATKACMASALGVLHGLHIPHTVCLSTGSENHCSHSFCPRTTDTVLSLNKEAIHVVSDILRCPCSTRFQVQLVIVVICAKLNAWYRAAIRNNYEVFFDPPSSVWPTPESSNVVQEDLNERVLHQPIKIGEYAFDVVLEKKVRAQVVFSELQQVKVLTKSLCDRIETTSFGYARNRSAAAKGGPTGRNKSEMVAAIHRNLTVFLHSQLRAVEVETNAILGGQFAAENLL